MPLGGAREVNSAVVRRLRSLPGMAQRVALEAERDPVPLPRPPRVHLDDLARIIVREHGKVLSDARGEVRRGLDVVEFACGIPHLLKGQISENVSTDVDTWSLRQPLGVVAGITPFNFPAMVPLWMFPMAIACGNTFVLKPSEKDPRRVVLHGRAVREGGVARRRVERGARRQAKQWTRSSRTPKSRAVSFVGSTPVARYIYENGTKAGKRVQALGGAKNHMVVMPDADLDQAAEAAVSAGYGSAGRALYGRSRSWWPWATR